MGLLNRKKKETSPFSAAPLLTPTSYTEDLSALSSSLVLGDEDEPALTLEDHVSPVEEEACVVTPLGVDRIRVGVTVKISKSYNTYESHFSAEGDPTLSSAEEVRLWVRTQCYDQLTQVLSDLGVDNKEKN